MANLSLTALGALPALENTEAQIVGRQNNTPILGPGGFRIGDYWRLGLPLEILLVAVTLPMLLWVWPAVNSWTRGRAPRFF